MKNISIKGILLGLVTLVLLDSIGAFALTMAFAGDLTETAVTELNTDTTFLILRSLVGVFSLIFGGFITAKVARHAVYINSGIVGVLSLMLTVLAYDASLPLWFNLFGFLFLMPAALTGGFIVYRKNESRKILQPG